MSRIIKVQNSLYQNNNGEEPDLSNFNLLSVFVLVQRISNYYPNYPTNRLYFGEVETPFIMFAAKVRYFPLSRTNFFISHLSFCVS